MAVRASSDRSKLAADALDHGTAAAAFDVGVRSAVAASAARWVPLSSHPLSRGTGARRSPTSAPANVVPIIRDVQRAGLKSLRAIADALNARGVRTARGGAWYASSVRDALKRVEPRT
jgi:hypothetical protein